jgi:hypothetical protein
MAAALQIGNGEQWRLTRINKPVAPAKAGAYLTVRQCDGISLRELRWAPAFAGATELGCCDPVSRPLVGRELPIIDHPRPATGSPLLTSTILPLGSATSSFPRELPDCAGSTHRSNVQHDASKRSRMANHSSVVTT